MKPTKFKIAAGAVIILMLFATGAWADGRGHGGRSHKGGGYGYHQGYQNHPGHHYRAPRHYRPHFPRRPIYRHHHHDYPARRDHRYYRPPPPYRHGYDGYGMHFSIGDPYFNFGFSVGGVR